MSRLTHLDAEGRARMVDVSQKPATAREAVAAGRIAMAPQTLPCRIPLGQKAAGWMAGKAAPGAA